MAVIGQDLVDAFFAQQEPLGKTFSIDGYELKVVGVEDVTVPAGTFEAYKLEIVAADNDADKQTVWIDKASRKVLKISAVLPSANGAVLTSELTP